MKKLQIVLAEDHKMMREGLRLLIDAQSDMEVVAEADDGRCAIRLTEKVRPDLVIMDVTMPGMNGLQATEEVLRVCPDSKVMALTRHTDNGYLQLMFAAGATGYVLKQSGSDQLLRGIRAVGAGQTYLDPGLSSRVVCKMLDKVPCPRRAGSSLSQREEEVLRCIAWGFLSRQIAGQLDISIKTVETHKANAMQKMGMTSRIDIVRYALLRGWMENV